MSLLRLALLLMLGSCFAPRVPSCGFACGDGLAACPPDTTCGNDGFCHGAGAAAACEAIDASVGVPDARIRDASVGPADARPPVDARRNDARVTDARVLDAPVPVDARIPDAMRPDAAQPDAGPDCATVCAASRICGDVGGCDCGVCEEEPWCDEFCADAICEKNNCCLPEDASCFLDEQCCADMICLSFCFRP